ncbi:hypothetical protein [Alteromonas macleodii]|uniref:hypothetical protein n=1 Tax=Alteromonas macleodii TaxID=28108 RepID=UPI0020769739|nr:hypothetical protein [Alteromonas macleodii]USI27909.1 hypothetical protein NFG60_19730 [Alteromonas macleodii]
MKQQYVDYLNQCENANCETLSMFSRTLAFDQKASGLPFDAKTITLIADDASLSNSVRFSAWYTLFLSMRRLKSAPQKMAKLIEAYSNEFEQYALFKVASAVVLSKQQEYAKAIEKADSALSMDSTNLGFIATYVDISIQWADSNSDMTDIDEKVWRKTKRLINTLIDQNPKYAKYQFFYSQFLLIEKHLEEAERRILLAIDIENEDSSDYLLRLSDYQAHYLKVRTAALELELNNELSLLVEANAKLQHEHSEFHSGMNAMKAELKETQRQSFQFITVFIAVISILLSSIKALNFSNVEQLVQFMLVMTLSLLLFFCVLFGLVSIDSIRLRVALVFIGALGSSLLLYHVI